LYQVRDRERQLGSNRPKLVRPPCENLLLIFHPVIGVAARELPWRPAHAGGWGEPSPPKREQPEPASSGVDRTSTSSIRSARPYLPNRPAAGFEWSAVLRWLKTRGRPPLSLSPYPEPDRECQPGSLSQKL